MVMKIISKHISFHLESYGQNEKYDNIQETIGCYGVFWLPRYNFIVAMTLLKRLIVKFFFKNKHCHSICYCKIETLN
jgi:hypothetical protein